MSDAEQLKFELKQLIVKECEIEIEAEQISNDEYLLGSAGRLGLDSLDALQIAVAVHNQYGKRIDGGRDTRKALTSVNTLAEFILA